MRSSRDPRADIIRYWRDVEIFEPQRIPKAHRGKYIYDVVEGEPLPWEGAGPSRRQPLKKNEQWQYTVYCGVFSLDATFEVLKRYCGENPDAYDARARGEAALAGFKLDARGRLLPGSAVLSSSAWGLGRVHQLKGIEAGWSEGFPSAEQVFADAFDRLIELRRQRDRLLPQLLGKLSELLLGVDGTEAVLEITERVKELLGSLSTEAPTKYESNPPMDHDMLDAVRTVLLELTGTDGVLPQRKPTIRIECRIAKIREQDDEQAPQADFLNSFITEDLTAISRQAQGGRLNGALDTYLTEAAEPERVDVRESLADVYEATRPSRIPLGRWPAPPRHALALGQQLAVNNALHQAGMRGEISGVNGPPGTGKTTLLRDMFAALITERARKLADLARAQDGLAEDHRFSSGGRNYAVPQLRPDLCGFEILVASSNNGAVENVTAETPHANEIDERWRDGIDYFTEIGYSVLNAGRLNQADDKWEPAWSLMAAVLGNATNRANFTSAFWFGLRESDRHPEPRPGMLEHLKTCLPERSWAEAKRRFKLAEAKVVALVDERERYYKEWATLEQRERETDDLAEAKRIAAEALAVAEHTLTEVASRRDRGSAEVERTRLIRDEWDRERPKLFAALLRGGGQLREWRRRARQYADAANEAWDQRQRLDHEAATAATASEGKTSEHAEAERSLQRALAARARHRVAVERSRERFGAAYPNLGEDRAAREMITPWCDEEFNTARSELFLESLRLHRAFIEHNRDRFKRGLGVAVDVVSRKVPADLAHEIRLAAWKLLFIAVPVVSTTFASVARQFTGLQEGDLGWLFIDEAGQATPQAAVGAIWRSRHVMAVGDPLQLEPVLSLPHAIQHSLREHYGLSGHWVPGGTSVQRLADAHTAFGTELPGPDGEKLWVGSPLTVHRRCEEPMFSISNRIAYDGLMLNDTPLRDALELPGSGAVVTRSMWLGVQPTANQGHWIPDEGARLDGLLTHLRDNGFNMAEVMVITPFVEVAVELRKRRGRFGIVDAGTVHTAQGKQADIVVLVLGGDPAKPGAGSFAAEKPNFVNVAVSRAKRRLFVIGDHETWSRLPNFGELAAALGDPR